MKTLNEKIERLEKIVQSGKCSKYQCKKLENLYYEKISYNIRAEIDTEIIIKIRKAANE